MKCLSSAGLAAGSAACISAGSGMAVTYRSPAYAA